MYTHHFITCRECNRQKSEHGIQIPQAFSTKTKSKIEVLPTNVKDKENKVPLTIDHKNSEQLVCLECGKKCKHYSSLYKHKKSSHTNKQADGPMRCMESGCTYTCHFLSQLRDHLKIQHAMPIEVESHTFESLQGRCTFEIDINTLH